MLAPSRTNTARARSLAAAALLLLGSTPAVGILSCPGDCNRDNHVGVDELITGVNIALGSDSAEACAASDVDRDGHTAIDELVGSVARALDGCPYPHDHELRLNQLQVVGSHNSFHIRPRDLLYDTICTTLGACIEAWDYTHSPLDQQFDTEGVRQIELDVFADPEGGLYANRDALRLLGMDPASGIPALDEPGFKVLHIQDIDFETTCVTFVECLQVVKAWSDAHPGHVPMMILVEGKEDVLPSLFGLNFTIPVPIRDPELDLLDAEIRSVFPPAQLITPDDVRGSRARLEEAVRLDGWPTLGETRGRILFALDNGGAVKAAYTAGHPSLAGRILFTSAEPGEDEAAFVKLNDPVTDFAHIQELVADGFIVRTRADSDTVEARSGDTSKRDTAIASGAQWVSSDYPVPDPRLDTGYQVTIPMGMPAACNPISAPSSCTSLDIENPSYLVSAVGP